MSARMRIERAAREELTVAAAVEAPISTLRAVASIQRLFQPHTRLIHSAHSCFQPQTRRHTAHTRTPQSTWWGGVKSTPIAFCSGAIHPNPIRASVRVCSGVSHPFGDAMKAAIVVTAALLVCAAALNVPQCEIEVRAAKGRRTVLLPCAVVAPSFSRRHCAAVWRRTAPTPPPTPAQHRQLSDYFKNDSVWPRTATAMAA